MNTEKLDGVLNQLVNLGVHGCSAVVYRDHKELYRGKSGYNDTENNIPIEYSDIVNLYSSTKVITCTAIMQLLGSGKFLLDDPLYYYIPEFRDMQVRHCKGNCDFVLRPAKKHITIRDLMTMSSGLNYDLNCEPIKRVREATDGRCPTVEIVRALASQPLCFDPGEHYRYGLSHDVLGAFIEIISGKKFGDYLKENIFDPLEMNDTSFELPDEKKSRLMCQYQYDPNTKR